nr:hypothetical protein [Baekduia soli]
MALSPGEDPQLYVGELGPLFRHNLPWQPDIGARISILDRDGAPQARLGTGRFGTAPDQFIAPHGIAVDDRGDIYLAEVAFTAWGLYGEGPPPADLTTLRKLTRVPPDGPSRLDICRVGVGKGRQRS